MTEHIELMGRRPAFVRAAIWAVKAAMALFFAYAATNKLLGVERSVLFFKNIGVGQWFRYFTGVFEITAGILLMIPVVSLLGSLLMGCISIGAVATLLFLGLHPTPALITLVVSAALAFFG